MNPGKLLIILGLILVLAGLIVILADRIPFLGRLPGDIRIERDNLRIYFPLGTCLLISLLLSLILWFFRK